MDTTTTARTGKGYLVRFRLCGRIGSAYVAFGRWERATWIGEARSLDEAVALAEGMGF